MLRATLILPALVSMLGLAPSASGGSMAAAVPGGSPTLSLGTVRTLLAPTRAALRFQPSPGRSSADTIPIFADDLEALSSPGMEGGWTHVDVSGGPPTWNISSTYGCGSNAYWCGLVDSSWTGDPNRRGYGNGWDETLRNFVDLSGTVPPYTLSFNHRMNAESGFDFGEVSVLDPTEGWTEITFFTGVVNDQGMNPCKVYNATIPDSIPPKINPLPFRFRFVSDSQGSSEDGLYANAEGWAIDNVKVTAGVSDIRFFDDMESGPGTWVASTAPPAGDYWRTAINAVSEELCTTNSTRVWRASEPTVGGLVRDMDDLLMSPPISMGQADQAFLSFDVYRDLSLVGCFYYEISFRTRIIGAPGWSSWQVPNDLLYFGEEHEWLRQTVPLIGAGGADSVQFRIRVKDYGSVFCSGNSDPAGSDVLFDNFVLGVIGNAGPSLEIAELNRFQDTFKTVPFFADDNLNTARGDSAVVHVAAANGLKQASFHYSLNGAPFVTTSLAPVGPSAPGAHFADVPGGSYPRGTELRYYFSASDSMDAVVTLPVDALGAGHYFTATVLPAVHQVSAACPDDVARVLYVNAYSDPDAPSGMDSSLTAIGIRYDRYDVNAAANSLGNGLGGGATANPARPWPAVPLDSLARYNAILWDVGARRTATLTPEDQTLLQSFLGLAGRKRGVLLFGEDLAYDLVIHGRGISGFVDCTLGAQFWRDVWETLPQDSLTPTLRGATGTPIALEPFPLEGGCPGINRFDALNASACVGGSNRRWIRYPNNEGAAIERARVIGAGPDSGRSFLFGFSLASTPDPVRRNLLLYRTLVEEARTPGCYVPTAVSSPAPGTPGAKPWLGSPIPNPFNPFAAIPYRLEVSGQVLLQIFDVRGSLVRTLVDGRLEAGPHEARWDGRDGQGRAVRSGAYFCRLEAAGARLTRKAVLLR